MGGYVSGYQLLEAPLFIQQSMVFFCAVLRVLFCGMLPLATDALMSVLALNTWV